MTNLTDADDKPTGIETLRTLVTAMANLREDFLDPFTPEQLMQLHAVWRRSKWSEGYYPDQWSRKQVAAALVGIDPEWDDDGEPVNEIEVGPGWSPDLGSFAIAECHGVMATGVKLRVVRRGVFTETYAPSVTITSSAIMASLGPVTGLADAQRVAVTEARKMLTAEIDRLKTALAWLPND